MNKNINPVAALVVIAFFGGLIALSFTFNQKLLELDRLTFMGTQPNENLAIQFGNKLFHVSPDNNESQITNLATFGIENNVGGFAFFSNSDLLIRMGNDQLTATDKADVFLRNENNNYTEPERNGIYRCALETKYCTLFSPHLPGFDRTFRLFIEQSTDTVYLADTSRHRIQKFDENGELLATQSGFKFPNQITLINDSLWVADTNHHRIVELSPVTATFGNTLSEQPIKLDGKNIWPSAFAHFKDQWWVIIMQNGMNNGRIMRYSETWQPIGEINLPPNADPVSITTFKGSIVIADSRTFTLYHFGLDGERLTDLAVPGLSEHLAQNKKTARKLELYNQGCWVIFAIGLVIGFYVAIKQAISDSAKTITPSQPSNINLEKVPDSGIWLEANKTFKMMPKLLGLILLVTFPPLLAP